MIVRQVIALEARLKQCRNVLTIGVRPNFSDYTPEEINLIESADRIFYPTVFYADLFDTIGKKTFPSYHTYKFTQDKIKQTALFELLRVPHPRTRIFYGSRQKRKISSYFNYPFIAKVPRGSALGRGVFLIQNEADLAAYLSAESPAYIQEYFPIKRDIRVVIIGKEVAHAYWRIAKDNEFRTNVAAGGKVCLDPVPEEALNLARHVAHTCHWDDVGIDICFHRDRPYILEANMKYGKDGFRQAGIDYVKLMESLIAKKAI
jgi:ribosomal protein S6--L-glutamate ligase